MAKKDDKVRIEKILTAIGQGMTQKDAAILSGIDETTLSRWKKKDADFAEKLAQKELEFKQLNVTIIQNAALGGTWQASAWLLERKYSSEFAVKADITDEAKRQLEELQGSLKGFFKENVGSKRNKMERRSAGASGNRQKVARPVQGGGKEGK